MPNKIQTSWLLNMFSKYSNYINISIYVYFMYMICYKFAITRHQTCVVDFSFVFTIVYQTKINCPALVSFFCTWVSYGVIFYHFFGHKNNTKITYKYI